MEELNWDDLTIAQYEQIGKIQDMKISEVEKCVAYLSVLDGQDEDYYLNMPIDYLLKKIRIMEPLKGRSAKPRIVSDKYTINGKQYTLMTNEKKMTAGQFIDFQGASMSNPNDLARICSIFLIPKGKSYGDGYDPLQLRDELYHCMTISDAMGICFFFLEKSRALLDATLSCLIRRMKMIQRNPFNRKTKEQKEALRQSIEKLRGVASMFGTQSSVKL